MRPCSLQIRSCTNAQWLRLNGRVFMDLYVRMLVSHLGLDEAGLLASLREAGINIAHDA